MLLTSYIHVIFENNKSYSYEKIIVINNIFQFNTECQINLTEFWYFHLHSLQDVIDRG